MIAVGISVGVVGLWAGSRGEAREIVSVLTRGLARTLTCVTYPEKTNCERMRSLESLEGKTNPCRHIPGTRYQIRGWTVKSERGTNPSSGVIESFRIYTPRAHRESNINYGRPW